MPSDAAAAPDADVAPRVAALYALPAIAAASVISGAGPLLFRRSTKLERDMVRAADSAGRRPTVRTRNRGLR